jgi:hypothetical protein
MTRDEAKAEAERLAAEHPERATHRWLPREQADGGWSVAKVTLPPGMRADKLKETVEAKPEPPQADDPRTAHSRNVGGPYAV